MKKLLFILLILPLFSLAQEREYKDFYRSVYSLEHKTNDKYFPKEAVIKNYDIKTCTQDQLNIEFIRYCSKRSYVQHRNAYYLYGLSVISSGVALLANTDDFKSSEKYANFVKYANIASVGFGLIGTFLIIDANKWKIYSSVQPGITEIGVVIKLK